MSISARETAFPIEIAHLALYTKAATRSVVYRPGNAPAYWGLTMLVLIAAQAILLAITLSKPLARYEIRAIGRYARGVVGSLPLLGIITSSASFYRVG